MQRLPISIFPINSKPYGHTYGEWSAKWWQWVATVPKANNPLADLTGMHAKINQNCSNVFFLCQTYEGVNPMPSRLVQIPAGRAIFMPIINWISILYNDGQNDEELLNNAKKRMNAVGNLVITINGVTINQGLERFRTVSPFFEFDLPEDNILGLSRGRKRAVSDGYWLFIEKIDCNLRLTSFGSCSSGITRIGVNYNITIL